MLFSIYSIITSVIIYALAIFVAALILRLIFTFADPNPFGNVGRFSFWLRKNTEKFVYPAARLLAQFRIDTRYAPIVTILVSCVLAYFLWSIITGAFFIIDKLIAGILAENIKQIIGVALYAILSIYTLFIFIRFISSWFVFTRNTFFGFVQRVTDPVLIPLRRLIPPIGMFDISAMILLILISFLQGAIRNIFGF